MTRKQIKQIVEETKKIKQKNINLSSQLAEHIRENYSNIVYHYEDIKVIEAITESIVNRTTDSVSELANVFLENLKRGVDEARVPQLSPGGADYSKHSTDELNAMLRPGVMHRNESKFKTLIRRELKKREKQGVAEGAPIVVAQAPIHIRNPKKQQSRQDKPLTAYQQGVAAQGEPYKNPHPFDPKAGADVNYDHNQYRAGYKKQGVAEGSLNEIGYADDLDDSNFSSDRLLKLGKVVGQIEGNDVMMASGGSEKVYFLVVDNQVSAFLGFRNNQLKNIKNFTNTEGVVRALIGFLVHKKGQKLIISQDEPMTPAGLKWISRLIKSPRGLTITDQNNEPVDVETLEREISSAKNSGTHGPTSITISENKVFGKKLRENEKLRESQSLLMPVNFYKTPKQGVAEGKDDKINASKPRNFVAKNATTGGAGAHKDKKKAAKQGDVKHKNKDIHMAETEKNPYTSALGRALYRDLSKEKKASPQQVQRNKERWAQRQADKEQGVAEGWKEKVAGGVLGAEALGGIGAGIAYSPMAYVNGQQIHMAMPTRIPDNAKLVTADDGRKIYVWKSHSIKGRADWHYRPAEDIKEGAKVDRMAKHITKSERELGHSTKDAESIAWATIK